MYTKDFDKWGTLKAKIENKIDNHFFREKEIWWCSIGENIGGEICGKNESFERPVLVIKKFSSNTAFVLPITSKISEGNNFCNIFLNNQNRSVLLHQGKFISSKRLVRRIEKLSDNKFNLVLKRFLELYKIESPPFGGLSPVPNGKDIINISDLKNKSTNHSKNILELVKKLWDYLKVGQKIEPADVIIVLGSRDVGPLYKGVQLMKQGYGKFLVLSGGVVCKNPNNSEDQTEAGYYKDLAINEGIDQAQIVVENKSTNTGDNLLFSKKVLEDLNVKHDQIIFVQKPYMERRTYATACAQWLGPNFSVTSEDISMEDFLKKEDVDWERSVNTMVGDLQRIKFYPQKGFQIRQEIPVDVWTAFEKLVSLGFNQRLIKE